MTFPGALPEKTIMGDQAQPRLVEKATGHVFVLVRDDTATTGKLHVAPLGLLTSMQSVKPADFKERFDWYTPPSEREVPVREVMAGPVNDIRSEAEQTEEVTAAVATVRKRAGRPKGSRDRVKRRSRADQPKTPLKPTEEEPPISEPPTM